MWLILLVGAATLVPRYLAQCQGGTAAYLNLGMGDPLGTRIISNLRQPIDASSIPQVDLDKTFVGLKPKGDGNNMKGKTAETDAGKVSLTNNKEIDSGKPLDAGHFPWHVGITMDGQAFCSGALLSSRHVVTVAHCVQGYTNFTISLGAINRNAFETDVLVMSSDNKVTHQSFAEDTLAFDVALITLSVPIATNGVRIRPVSLPKRSDVLKTFTKEKAILTGWGFRADGACSNPMLSRASVTIMELSDCWKVYGDVVSYQTMCVTEPNLNTCFINDGSPLVSRDSDNTWSLLGLVSFRGDAGCSSGHPVGIMRMTSVLAWLSEHTSVSVRN